MQADPSRLASAALPLNPTSPTSDWKSSLGNQVIPSSTLIADRYSRIPITEPVVGIGRSRLWLIKLSGENVTRGDSRLSCREEKSVDIREQRWIHQRDLPRG